MKDQGIAQDACSGGFRATSHPHNKIAKRLKAKPALAASQVDARR